MFRNKKSLRKSNRRPNLFFHGRSLRYETMENRLVLSATGFAGNEYAPELDDAALDAIVPSATQVFTPQSEIAFQFSAANVVTDGGADGTLPADISFILDPDIDPQFRSNGSTPVGARLTANDQGTPDVADDTWDFSWTPTDMQQGLYRLFIIATDGGGTGNIPLSDVYAFTLSVDDQPTVDLNGDNDVGIDFAANFTEGGGPVSIVDTDLSIPFVSNNLVSSATVEIANPQAGEVETLGITGGTLIVDSSTPGRLVISVSGGGLADKALFEDALRTLTYDNTSDDPIASQSINVTISDGTNDSAAAVATVTNIATNDRPNLLQIQAPANAQVGQEYTLDLVAEDPDGGDLLVFQLQFAPDGAVITPNPTGSSGRNTIQVARDATDGLFHAQIVWTPTETEGDNSPILFRVSVTDTGGSADSEDYLVAIENQAPAANDDPTAGNDPFAVGEDDTATNVGNILTNDNDADGDTFSVDSVIVSDSAVADPTSFTTAKGGLVTIAANGDVTYDPNGQFESLGSGQTDTDTFRYTIIDVNSNVSAEATVTVTINGANDAPTAVQDVIPEFRISESDGATELPLATLLTAINDVDDGDMHSVSSAPTDPVEGGIFALNGVLTFDPNGEFGVVNGAEEMIDFMVTIEDAAGAPVTIAARIIIEGGNDAPVAVNDPANSTDEDTTLTVDMRINGILANDTDDGGNAGLTVAQVNGDAANVGTPIVISDGSSRMGELTVTSNGTFTFNPSSDFNSLAVGEMTTVTFTYVATDGSADNNLSNEATVTITIDGVNDAPTAADVSIEAVEDGPTVDGNFSGTTAEMDALTFMLTSAPGAGEGTVLNNDDGTFTFDPGSDFQELAEGVTAEVAFDYKAIDAALAESSDATVTVTVTGANDAPEFNLDALTTELANVGAARTGDTIAVILRLGSPSGSLTADISMFTSDIDLDIVTFSLDSGNNGGTAFRPENRPSLTPQGILTWTPTAADNNTGYVIRVRAADQPVNGGALSTSFDILVTVTDQVLI